jgi:hypothetical protein
MSQQPGQYINYLAVRNLVPLREQDLQYNQGTVFAIDDHGLYAGYNPSQWFSTIGYNNPSTIEGKIVQAKKDLQSTVAGLGSAGYISSATLASTVAGLSVYTPVSVDGLRSTITSTIAGLGSAGYISSPQLDSTIAGLGSVGYLSSMDGSINFSTIITGSISTATATVGEITLMDNEVPIKIYSRNGVLHYGTAILGTTTTDIEATSVTASDHITTANLYSEKHETKRVALGKHVDDARLYAITNTNTIHYSDDHGSNWTQQESAIFDTDVHGIKYMGDKWIAYGRGSSASIKYSTDNGLTWADSAGSFFYDCLIITYSDKMLVAGGRDAISGSGITLKYSVDGGLTWLNAESGQFLHKVSDILYNGVFWIAVGLNNPSIKYSADGINWTNCNGDWPINPKSIAYNGSTYVVAGDDCAVYSKNGVDWRRSVDLVDCRKIIWNTRNFLLITAEDLKTSIDGKTYNSLDGIFQHIFWDGIFHYVIDDHGAIYKSDYDLNWEKLNTPFSNTKSIDCKQNYTGYIEGPNMAHYGGTVPHYHYKNNQMYHGADKMIANNTLTITKNGRVGIAQQDPQYELDIQGTVRANNLIIDETLLNGHKFEIQNNSILINNIPILETAVKNLGSVGYVSTTALENRLQQQLYFFENVYATKENMGRALVSTVENMSDTINRKYLELDSTIADIEKAISKNIENVTADLNRTKIENENRFTELNGLIQNTDAENQKTKSDLLTTIKSVENKCADTNNELALHMHSTTTAITDSIVLNATAAQTALIDAVEGLKTVDKSIEHSIENLRIQTDQSFQSTITSIVTAQKSHNDDFNSTIQSLQNKDVVLKSDLEKNTQINTATIQDDYNAKLETLKKSIAENNFTINHSPSDPSLIITKKENSAHILLADENMGGICLESNKIYSKNTPQKSIDFTNNLQLNSQEIVINSQNTSIKGNLHVNGTIEGIIDLDSLSAVPGTAQNPPFNFAKAGQAGSSTGLYYPQENTMAVTINGEEKMRIDQSVTAIQGTLKTTDATIQNGLTTDKIFYNENFEFIDRDRQNTPVKIGKQVTIQVPLLVSQEIHVGQSKITATAASTTIQNGNASVHFASDGSLQLGNSLYQNPGGQIGIGVESPTAEIDISGTVKINGITSYSAAAFGTISRLADFRGKNIKSVDYSDGIWTITLLESLPNTSYNVVVGLADDSPSGSVLFYESGIKTANKFQVKSYNAGSNASLKFSFALFI